MVAASKAGIYPERYILAGVRLGAGCETCPECCREDLEVPRVKNHTELALRPLLLGQKS